MKKLHIMLATFALATIGAIGVSDVQAGPALWTFQPDTATVLGGLNTSTVLVSPQFRVTMPSAYAYFGATVIDTGAGNGALTDSVIFSLQKLVDIGSSNPLWPDSGGRWINVQALPAFDPTKAAGKTHYMSRDSIELGVYELGGLMRFRAYKGGGQSLDTLNARYTVRVWLETGGAE